MLHLLISLCLVFSHEFYISITQIDHNPKNESLEITVKLFTDDIEKALETTKKEKLNLGDEKEHEKANEFLEEYVEHNLELFQNEEAIDLNFLGKEVDLDVTWCYFEATDIESISTLTVENNLLLDILDGQSNIVHVKYNDKESSLLLNRDRTRDQVKF